MRERGETMDIKINGLEKHLENTSVKAVADCNETRGIHYTFRTFGMWENDLLRMIAGLEEPDKEKYILETSACILLQKDKDISS